MTKCVLFDLDGTLLPMQQDVFVNGYFNELSKYFAVFGYEPQALISAVWQGTKAMIMNTGEQTNEAVFWKTAQKILGDRVLVDKEKFDLFYEKKFPLVKSTCGFNPDAAKAVRLCREKGHKVILATNPIFPAAATLQRLSWAGLNYEDFELITTYENSSYCKPNLNYYKEICQRLNISCAECAMIGNDVTEDMIARKLGMKTFLLTDCLINSTNADISNYENGGFDKLFDFLKNLEAISL